MTSLVGSGVTCIVLAAFAYGPAGGNANVMVGTALMPRILACVLFSPIAESWQTGSTAAARWSSWT